MPGDRRLPQRSELPHEFTPETIRQIPIAQLTRLARPGNGVLDPQEQQQFDTALHQVMSETAHRFRQGNPDLARVLRDAHDTRRAAGGRSRPSRADVQLNRLARQIGQQVDVAEGLAPGVDWSFAQPAQAAPPIPDTGATPDPTDTADSSADQDSDETVSDLEQRLTDQVELVQVMSEIADVSKRAYALEQQRDLQTTRGVFFAFVVSVAVLVAGWAPIVAAKDWSERWWDIGLTLGTCAVAGLVYALVRRWQVRHAPDGSDADQA